VYLNGVFTFLQKKLSTMVHFPAHLVTIDPDIVSGTPVFKGTRVPVKSLFDWLETESIEEFLENFPSVSRSQAVALLRFAESMLFNTRPKNEAIAG
jgi:uncharacterized protein (DUF433 family)